MAEKKSITHTTIFSYKVNCPGFQVRIKQLQTSESSGATCTPRSAQPACMQHPGARPELTATAQSRNQSLLSSLPTPCSHLRLHSSHPIH